MKLYLLAILISPQFSWATPSLQERENRLWQNKCKSEKFNQAYNSIKKQVL